LLASGWLARPISPLLSMAGMEAEADHTAVVAPTVEAEAGFMVAEAADLAQARTAVVAEAVATAAE
jgi:hypothetical protein